MKIAFIGLGNMGGPMAHNLHKAGHEVRAFDLSQPARDFHSNHFSLHLRPTTGDNT